MERRILTVNNVSGLHARPAAAFSVLAKKYMSSVRINAQGKALNGKSVVAILSAGIARGACIEIETEGADEKEAIKALEIFVQSGCGEQGR